MKPEYSCFSIYNYGQIMKNVFFIFVLICVSVGIISSCSKDEEVAATNVTSAGTTEPNTDAALVITGQTMTIGSIGYTTSMVSACTL